MFLIAPLHFGIERSKVNVEDEKNCRNRFSAVTMSHVLRFISNTDQSVPIPRQVCLSCVALRVFSLLFFCAQYIGLHQMYTAIIVTADRPAAAAGGTVMSESRMRRQQ